MKAGEDAKQRIFENLKVGTTDNNIGRIIGIFNIVVFQKKNGLKIGEHHYFFTILYLLYVLPVYYTPYYINSSV